MPTMRAMQISEKGGPFELVTPDVPTPGPMIETLPLEQAGEAYDRMMAGDARFRMVLTM